MIKEIVLVKEIPKLESSQPATRKEQRTSMNSAAANDSTNLRCILHGAKLLLWFHSAYLLRGDECRQVTSRLGGEGLGGAFILPDPPEIPHHCRREKKLID